MKFILDFREPENFYPSPNPSPSPSPNPETLTQVGTVKIPVQQYKGIGKKLPVAQTFDQQQPNGKYVLEISDPGQRLVAQTLHEMWMEQVYTKHVLTGINWKIASTYEPKRTLTNSPA
eukprot:7565145-Pyramimonas_sp.AAC.1